MRQDTLVYQAGAFIEHNARYQAQPEPAGRLYKLGYRFRLGGPPRPDPGYDLLVNLKTGQVKSYAKYGYHHVIGTFRYRLRPGTLDTLRQQLSYVPVAQLATEYSRDAFDASSSYLTFYRRGQAPQEVEDYGDCGPRTLQQLYELLGEAYNQALAQRWQKLQARRPSQQ